MAVMQGQQEETMGKEIDLQYYRRVEAISPKALQELRERTGLGQEGFAEYAKISVRPLQRAEQGKPIQIEKATAIARALGTPLEALFQAARKRVEEGQTIQASPSIQNTLESGAHPEITDRRWMQLLDSLEHHQTYRVTDCAWVCRLPGLATHHIDLEYHSNLDPYDPGVSDAVQKALSSYRHPSQDKDAEMRSDPEGKLVRLVRFATEHDPLRVVFHLAPSRYLYYAAVHGRLLEPELRELRERAFTNVLQDFRQEAPLLLPSHFALHMGVITKEGYALLRQRRGNTELFTSAWEAGLGEFMHGPEHGGDCPHFSRSKPSLELFLKNAVAEELGYRGAKAKDFTIHGFAVEYQSLAPKLLVLYRSDAGIDLLREGATTDKGEQREKGKPSATDFAQDARAIKLNPQEIAKALKQHPRWGPTSRLVLMLALERSAANREDGLALVEEANVLL